MDATNRGVIQLWTRAEQGRDFSGLRFGNITPTDIDAVIDFGNRAFVFIEAKWKNGRMPYGQKLALERLCDAVEQSGRRALLVVISHDVPVTEQIPFATCRVETYRSRGQWYTPRHPTALRKLIVMWGQARQIAQAA